MNYIYLHGFASSPKSYKGSYIQQRFAEIGKTLH
ncbi:MAG: esterase, partial [Calditrichaeota bacterium]|nr:esterase [Calditrichota bacterium]